MDERIIYSEDVHRLGISYTIRRLISYLAGLLELVLAVRLVFKAAGANPGSGFTQFIYGLTAPFVRPFVGLFRGPQAGEIFIEWATIVAMLVFAVGTVLLIELVRIVSPVSHH